MSTYFPRHSNVCRSVLKDKLERRRQMAGELHMYSSQKRTGVRLEGVSLPACDAPTVYTIFAHAMWRASKSLCNFLLRNPAQNICTNDSTIASRTHVNQMYAKGGCEFWPAPLRLIAQAANQQNALLFPSSLLPLPYCSAHHRRQT